MIAKKNILFIIFSVALLLAVIGSVSFCEEAAVNQLENENSESRDPFASLLPKDVVYRPTDGNQAAAIAPTLVVHGLIWGCDKPQAIINNKIFYLGDEVEGAKIIEISKTGIKVLYQEKIFSFAPELIKGAIKKQ